MDSIFKSYLVKKSYIILAVYTHTTDMELLETNIKNSKLNIYAKHYNVYC